MYLDVSSCQGKINWNEVAKHGNINGVILRATTQNNKLDSRTIENYNGILQNMSDIDEISVYKFTYARTYPAARIECKQCLAELSIHGIKPDYIYLDIEKHSGRDYTREESDVVILAYIDEIKAFYGDSSKFRLYFNYNYLKNIISPFWWQELRYPVWLARYNKTIGDTFGANVVLWQYTSAGRINGITTNVDLSKEIAT